MPHDKDGCEIRVGDKVVIEATVEKVYEGATTCNVCLKTQDGTSITTNACCCEVCDEEDTEETE